MGILLLVALVAAACGSDDDSSGNGGGGTETPAVPADGELDPEATLRYATLGPATIDPHRTTCACEIVHLGPVYDKLVHTTPAGDPIPGLAESWEFSDDATTLTFHLREGVVFHDGTAFNAEAVKANIDRGLTLESSTVRGDLAPIESVEVVDDATVQLNLQASGAALPLILSHVVGSMVSPAALESGDLENTMVGTGPYELVEYVPGTRMVYERFDDYWDADGAAKVARIELMLSSDTTAVFNALRTGQLDVANVVGVDVAQAESLGFNIQPIGGLGFHQFQINRTIAPFDDVLVRQAINHAIDREAIFNAIAFGFGGVAYQPFPEEYFAHSPDADDLYPYDLDRARELLAEAGLEDGFSFQAVTPAGGDSATIAEILKSQLEAIGVEMEISTLEGAQFAPTFYGQGSSVPVGIVQWTARPDPRQTFSQLWSGTGFANPGQHTTPAFTEAFDAANRPQPDEASEAEAIQAVTTAVMEDALVAPIYFYTSPIAFTDRVVGLQPQVSSYVPLRALGMLSEG